MGFLRKKINKIKSKIRLYRVGKEITKSLWDFDIVNFIPDALFISFKNFYENGELDLIDWGSDKWHSDAKKEMDKIYFWVNYMQNKCLYMIDRITEKYYGNYEFKPLPDGNKSFISNVPDHVCKKLSRIEGWLVAKDNEYMKRIIDIRNYLWT